MRKTLVIGAVMAAFLQFGCAHRTGGQTVGMQKADKDCGGLGVCQIEVTAASSSDEQACTVEPEFKDVIIPVNKKPTVRWQIKKKDPHDRFDYAFAFTPPIYGVAIAGNDPAKDFERPGYGKDGHGNADNKTFEWTSKHDRASSLPYTLIVLRTDSNVASDPTVCQMVDPRMVNQ